MVKRQYNLIICETERPQLTDEEILEAIAEASNKKQETEVGDYPLSSSIEVTISQKH